MILSGLPRILKSTPDKPLPEHPKNNQTTYQKEHHNETNPNFKTSRAAALHLRT